MFDGDGFLAFSRNTSFLGDDWFAEAGRKTLEPQDAGMRWALHVLTWAAESSSRVAGDIVQLGRNGPRLDFLLNAGAQPMAGRTMTVYADLAEASAVPGVSRRSLDVETVAKSAPARIALLIAASSTHSAELPVLDLLFERMEPGAVLLIEDFGPMRFADRHIALASRLRARGIGVLEIATGQGLAIWR